jgi:uncharacterized protein (DUF362 family)/Pyruvate/2-oxoacid:ferredoxin oxidoreductase delta subunit
VIPQVAIVKCPDYRQPAVDRAVRESIDLLGGMGQFVHPSQKVLLKVNLLSATPPEKGVVTHPAVVEAVVKLVQEAGGNPLIADSPGASVPYTEAGLRRTYEASGLLELAERTGATLNWDTSYKEVSHPEGFLVKRLEVIKPVLEADVVISMPKLKTHVLTTFTGATKNLFGVVPGFSKGIFHARMRNVTHFALMLLDITSLVKPALVLMDAVVGMEGDGPSTGPLRDVGVILASRDGVALDAVATSMVGFDPLKVPTLREAAAHGLWTGKVDDIETLGASVTEVLMPDFQPPSASPRDDATLLSPFLTRHFGPLITNHFTLRPVPQRGRCVACGDCVAGCPQQVITIVDSLAVIDYNQCIRCYCCHEFCTEGAIDLEWPWLGGLMYRFFGMRQERLS